MTSPLDNEDERTPPQPERTRERGFEFDPDADEWDDVEPDEDDAGDIADEGRGHRG